MKFRNQVVAIVVIAIVGVVALTTAVLISQTHTTNTTRTSSASTLTATSISVVAPTITVPLVASSVNNACFVNGYNDSIAYDNGVYYNCFAMLTGYQSIKQNIFRSYPLYGGYSISINASQKISTTIAQNGAVTFTSSGSTISYRGNLSEYEAMSVTVANYESTPTSYNVTIDFPGVTI
jgi:hypothetical protein